jgi:hypothetical protein
MATALGAESSVVGCAKITYSQRRFENLGSSVTPISPLPP